MSLSIRQVRYFVAAADYRQISQAAIELNVSQSAVTAAIKQLEISTNKVFEDITITATTSTTVTPPKATATNIIIVVAS